MTAYPNVTIEIVTRHLPGREKYLTRNQASVKAQTRSDALVHTVITDHRAEGVGIANARLADFEPMGDYVWLVDDDDYISGADTVEQILDLIDEFAPDAVMVRYGIATHVVPEDDFWQQRPQFGHISGQCALVSADCWKRTRGAWTDKYASDYDWQSAIWEWAGQIAWLPLVAVRTDKPGRGVASL